MKKKIILGLSIIFTILLIGCDNDDSNDNEKSIVGTWQLIEIYSDIGDGKGKWNSIENGYKYEFDSENRFTSDRFSECQSGTYTLNENELILDYDCDGFTAGIETPEGTFVERITFESDKLIINPTYLMCVEGCEWKFQKID
ncbi:lipocalin family protein [Lutibacter agarilyticus]|nr:lipocalin family protein [Lutibacter agarilyticus]